MIYSEVVSRGLILPRKAKYTVRDCNSLLVGSLFTVPRTLTPKEARFIVKCSAVYHGTDWSRGVAKYGKEII